MKTAMEQERKSYACPYPPPRADKPKLQPRPGLREARVSPGPQVGVTLSARGVRASI